MRWKPYGTLTQQSALLKFGPRPSLGAANLSSVNHLLCAQRIVHTPLSWGYHLSWLVVRCFQHLPAARWCLVASSYYHNTNGMSHLLETTNAYAMLTVNLLTANFLFDCNPVGQNQDQIGTERQIQDVNVKQWILIRHWRKSRAQNLAGCRTAAAADIVTTTH